MQRISDRKKSDNSPYPIHLAFGHEKLASSVAVISSKDDRFSLTHRNIHFNIALSDPLERDSIIEESNCGINGINGGQFGCMTMRNIRSGVVYTSSILANNISVGLGIASTLDDSGICWIQTGDGAIEEGAFYEALLFASARKLKAVFLLENNNWSLGTSINERRKPIHVSDLCNAVCIDYICAHQDMSTRTLLKHLHYARCAAFNGPILLEYHVTTKGGHHDPHRGYVSYHHGPIG